VLQTLHRLIQNRQRGRPTPSTVAPTQCQVQARASAVCCPSRCYVQRSWSTHSSTKSSSTPPTHHHHHHHPTTVHLCKHLRLGARHDHHDEPDSHTGNATFCKHCRLSAHVIGRKKDAGKGSTWGDIHRLAARNYSTYSAPEVRLHRICSAPPSPTNIYASVSINVCGVVDAPRPDRLGPHSSPPTSSPPNA